MTHFKAIVIEKTSPDFGQIIGNTKSPGKYKGMTLEQFKEAVKDSTCWTIEIVAF